MGLVESKLNTQTTKPICLQDSSLPSFSMDTAKFSDGTSGFVITTTDLAKNSDVKTISVKFLYSPSENSLVFVGKNETIISFVKDRLTGKVVCSVTSQAKESIVRFCVETYETIDDELLDKIKDLYSQK